MTYEEMKEYRRLLEMRKLGAYYKPAVDEKRFERQKRIVDVCIPAYKEEGYIEYTIDKLMNQTYWRDGLMNIVIGEYSNNPLHLSGKKSSYLQELCRKNGVIHVFVPKKGMGYARNYTIDKGSMSDIICNLDADARFSRNDAVEMLVSPILESDGKIVSTYCETVIVPDDDKTRKQSFEEIMFRMIYDKIVIFEKNSPFGRSSGLTFKRQVFYRIDGFPLINTLEDYTTNYRISLMYGILARKFVSGVKVLASDRRAKALSKQNAFDVLSYQKDFR